MATLQELDEVLRNTLRRLEELEEGDSEVGDRYLRKARARVESLRTTLHLEALSQLDPPRRNSDPT